VILRLSYLYVNARFVDDILNILSFVSLFHVLIVKEMPCPVACPASCILMYFVLVSCHGGDGQTVKPLSLGSTNQCFGGGHREARAVV
jgi:hypothetical protein